MSQQMYEINTEADYYGECAEQDAIDDEIADLAAEIAIGIEQRIAAGDESDIGDLIHWDANEEPQYAWATRVLLGRATLADWISAYSEAQECAR